MVGTTPIWKHTMCLHNTYGMNVCMVKVYDASFARKFLAEYSIVPCIATAHYSDRVYVLCILCI